MIELGVMLVVMAQAPDAGDAVRTGTSPEPCIYYVETPVPFSKARTSAEN